MNTTAQDLTGTYYPAAPGARTLREARDLYIGGKRVSAVVTGRTAAVFIGGEIAFEGQLPADITAGSQVNAWAAETALNTTAKEAATVDAAETITAEAVEYPGSVAAHLATTATTPDEHRAAAAAYASAKQESYDRCDTDGALSQWSHGLNEGKQHLAAQIAENGGMWEFDGLFDLDGNLVPAKEIETRFGYAWLLLDDNGRSTGRFFNESKAKSEERRIAAHAKRGFYVGRVRVPAYAALAGGGVCTVMPIVKRKDGGFSVDAEIVDNGK
ncbi:hypothetical protein EDD90_2819 [Streptomyces sp. Ag109_O5-1]|uniref:hypothetical protein n=1 Tax=Streptomyces sp. Ag109_O5-1 TaxID=1938851 RepID=UPI000F501D85|nr:hypothetical protein [Streptomyces sp. Ag109_O5-1]RPE39801.1 hypothetical protein EDD90_2819 [Streptomyces sp. Ag109_O5-1]